MSEAVTRRLTDDLPELLGDEQRSGPSRSGSRVEGGPGTVGVLSLARHLDT